MERREDGLQVDSRSDGLPDGGLERGGLIEAGADVNLKLFDGADIDSAKGDFENWYEGGISIYVNGIDYANGFNNSHSLAAAI